MASKNTASGDERFSKVKKDPRFWEMPNRERKVKIDERFQSMFHDQRFKLKYTVDKRGRPVNHTTTEDLKRFYKLSDSEEEDEKTGKEQKADEEPQVEDEDESDESEEEEEAETVLKSAKKSKEPLIKGVRVFEEDEDERSGVEEDEEGGSSEGEGEDEDEESELDEDDEKGPDLARGKGNVETSSDEDDDEDELEEEEIEHNWGDMCKDAPRGDNTSQRLAVCNIDWDRLKAKDLLALFNSFKPKEGVVLSVTIYPSEFGKERMSAEQTQGPLELTSLPDDPDADTEEQRICREKVRDYQFKRLKYYYAVVECDSVETAVKIYEECDGLEYESSCSTIDLRFIPDDVTFDDEPKDRATDVDYGSYKPKLFTSAATTTAKVELTWDETDHDRVTALCRKFNKDELLDMDFKAYLASSSEEEEEEEEEEKEWTEAEEPAQPLPEEKKGRKGKKSAEQIAKYRDLLKGIQEDKDKGNDGAMDMEITWVPGLKETTEKLVKKKMMGKDVLSPWEEYLQKKKEKKKEKRKGKKEAEPGISDDELPADVDLNDPFFTEELGATESLDNKQNKKSRKKDEERTPEEQEELERRRAEMELLMADDEDDKHKHFNYDKIVENQNLSKKKRKKLLKSATPLENDEFKVDVHDPRFQSMFTSHLYNLDPSDPAYKKTKATQSILEEKLRRREEEETLKSRVTPKITAETSSAAKVMDPNLSLLVKSIKNKTQQFQARKKQKTK
ncbi:hypothetical protein R3I93_005788 [Phoxinus phoxinus]|uniref:ESF1 homolog n=1 Tax=Phoxinus phoxinus TaxID=58324 RepID=A0AAN9HDK0_9TELE